MKNLLLLLLTVTVIAACNEQQDSTVPEAEAEEVGYTGINIEYMDTTVSPSDDFYSYVNGNWMKNTDVPADRGRWGSFDELRKRTIHNTLAVLQDAIEDENIDPTSDKGKAAIFYKTAMDTSYLDKLGLKPISGLLSDIEAIETVEDIQKYIINSMGVNGSPYFSLGVRPEFANSNINGLYLYPGSLGLPDRDFYTNSDSATLAIQAEYKSMLSQVFSMLAGTEMENEDLVSDVFAIEKAMAEPRLTKVERRKPELQNNPMKIENAAALLQTVDLEKIISEQKLTNTDTITVTQLAYVKKLDDILKKYSIETHKNYLKWRALHTYGNYLDRETEEILFAFYGKTLRGTEQQLPRWERVLNTANRAVGEAIGQLYVDAYFPEEAKEEAQNLVDNVKKAFGERINQLSWMTEETKEKALEKLSTFNVKIAYPDEWKDYSDLTIAGSSDDGSYAGNMMAVRAWNWQDSKDDLGNAVDKSEWFMAPQVVNAYYSSSFNEIVFPAAILQPPFFDFKADPAVNYGGIGAVIGHEISHGFDDQGSKYDAEGNLKNWWTDTDRMAFDALTGRLAEQYDAYKPFKDLAVNGKFTLGENIGDLGGVNVAYDALMMHLENEDVPLIDGMTQEQRFFINWATIWRTKYKDEALRNQIKTDPHSPGMYRAVGPIINMDEFYAAFDIKEGDKLFKKEEDRIKIW